MRRPTHPRLPPPRTRGIQATDVDQAADALLREGERPTIEKIRARIGRGSPNTINPLLDAWWKRLASRLDAGPHALHRIPESIAQITEVLWLKALDAARERARAEERTSRGQLERDRREVDLRVHVLSLRESEFEDRLKERDSTIGTLEEQIRALMRLVQQEQANRAAALRRIAALEASLKRAEARVQALFADLTTGTPTGSRRREPTASRAKPLTSRRQRPAPIRRKSRTTTATRKPAAPTTPRRRARP
jgi:hypothetical protein